MSQGFVTEDTSGCSDASQALETAVLETKEENRMLARLQQVGEKMCLFEVLALSPVYPLLSKSRQTLHI